MSSARRVERVIARMGERRAGFDSAERKRAFERALADRLECGQFENRRAVRKIPETDVVVERKVADRDQALGMGDRFERHHIVERILFDILDPAHQCP